MDAMHAKIEAERLLDLLLRHQPALIKNSDTSQRSAEDIAGFIEHLRAALLQKALARD